MSTLTASEVTVTFGRGRTRTTALRDFSLVLEPGASIAVAGESGGGKTTAARVLAGMIQPTSGRVTWSGTPLAALPPRGPGSRPRAVQLIFQDPYSSLNRRLTVRQTIAEVLEVNRIEVDPGAEVRRLLDIVGLDPGHADRYPFEFSGGQRQRIAIARALAAHPQVIIADEVTSALDVSVQASILNLLRGLRVDMGLSMIVISHNLDVVRYLCDEVFVVSRSRVVEKGPTEQVFTSPRDPYTAALLNAVPRFSHTQTSADSAARP